MTLEVIEEVIEEEEEHIDIPQHDHIPCHHIDKWLHNNIFLQPHLQLEHIYKYLAALITSSIIYQHIVLITTNNNIIIIIKPTIIIIIIIITTSSNNINSR